MIGSRFVLASLATVISASFTAPAAAETPLERGTYLMQSIVACGNCHTPKGPEGELPGMELAGGPLINTPAFDAFAPNITPDPETGIGAWSDEEIANAIRNGVRPDGSLIGPIMPIGLYRGLSDADVSAIVAYMRQVPAVRNEVPKTVYRMPLPPSYGPPVTTVPEVEPSDRLAYGAYLAGPAGHCIECHTPMSAEGAPDFENQLGAGGFEFEGPWGVSVSANITPTGLGDWTDRQIKTAVTTGVRPDGTRLQPPMGYPYYARMTDSDLDAIIYYLRTLPPK